jgi:hypothetical protein
LLHEYASTFLVFKLVPFLNELGCADSLQSKAISWFHQNAGRWSAGTQQEFDAEARARLKVFVTTLAIKQGTQKSLSPQRRHLQCDAIQQAWVSLLESGADGGRAANIAGRNAGHDIGRTELRYVSVERDDEADEDDDALPAPWDAIDESDRYRSWSAEVEQFLRDYREDIRRTILNKLRDERPDDYAFLVDYIERRWGSRFTRQQRDRAKSIIDRLRRQEQREVGEKEHR